MTVRKHLQHSPKTSTISGIVKPTSLLRVILWSVLALFLIVARPVQAQFAGSMNVTSTLPPPPAWIIAQKMADRGDWVAALKKLNDITTSAMYRGSNYVPEAMYSMAHIDEDRLHDDNSAIAQLNTLFNNYQSPQYQYPHKAVIAVEREALGSRIDFENRRDALKGPSDWGSIPSIWQGFLQTGYLIIDFAVKLTGSKNWSYPVALLLIAVTIRLLMWPLTVKQYKSMKEMQRIAPMIKELKAKYEGDQQTFAAKQMELYKEHNINPMAGCGPVLLQLPVMFYMYHAVWLYQYNFSHGTFLWIGPAMHALFPSYIGASLADQDEALLVLYAVSMYITQRMMPVNDPTQAEMMKSQALMSAFVSFFLFNTYHLPSAFILYWLFSNIVSTCVQLYAMRSGGYMKPPASGGATPADGDPELITNGMSSKNGTPATVSGTVVSTNGTSNNGSNRVGTAKGIIGPKVHPKKKRR